MTKPRRNGKGTYTCGAAIHREVSDDFEPRRQLFIDRGNGAIAETAHLDLIVAGCEIREPVFSVRAGSNSGDALVALQQDYLDRVLNIVDRSAQGGYHILRQQR